MLLTAKVIIAITGIFLWLQSQKWIGRQAQKIGQTSGREIQDRIHQWLSPWHQKLLRNVKAANALLISSSLVIDILGFYLIFASLFGPTLRPLLGLFLLFGLRQLNQALTSLPVPEGMIWRHPGFPSVFVTYGVSNDLFFSGHTALAVYGALELATAQSSPWFYAFGGFIIAFEVLTVLALRAHWNMDVFTGAITALWAHGVVLMFAPTVDAWLLQAVARLPNF